MFKSPSRKKCAFCLYDAGIHAETTFGAKQDANVWGLVLSEAYICGTVTRWQRKITQLFETYSEQYTG